MTGKLLASLVVIMISGCILPIPHRRLHVYGVRGQVVDAYTLEPVPCAVIWSSCGEPVRTDEDGEFALRAIRGWHGGVLIGIALNYSALPFLGVVLPFREIDVAAPGYYTRCFELRGSWDYPDREHIPPNETLAGVKAAGDYLEARGVMLEPVLDVRGTR